VGYRGAKSHDFIAIEECGVARPEVQAGMERLRGMALEPSLREVEIRSDGSRVAFAFKAEGRVDRTALAPLEHVAIEGRATVGDPQLWLTPAGVALRASPRSFYQVNLEVNALLVSHVRDLVVALEAERVLDLYAGLGNFALPLAATGLPVVAVERDGQATDDLTAAAARANLDVSVLRLPVERFDPSREAFDVAIVDPPRKGARGVLARAILNRPRAIIYVGCDPVAAARDVREATGYRVDSLTCFDMFPETHHVETVAVLVRA
jgi:23S rRNA (uracil1939-C5)-methyltransferase